MSRIAGMIALVAVGSCLVSGVALAETAPADVIEVAAADAGQLTMRLKLVLAFLIVSAIAWLSHRSASSEQQAAGKLAPIKI